MLTDIFSFRYLKHPVWISYGEVEQRLLNQLMGIADEAIPYYSSDGKEIESNKEKWKLLHNRLARELGIDELSPRYYSYMQKNGYGTEMPVSGFWGWNHVCSKFVKAPFNPQIHSPDRFIKERISLIELVLRLRGEEITQLNANLPQAILEAQLRSKQSNRGMRIPGDPTEGMKAWNKAQNSAYSELIDEANVRFWRAGAPLTYHNGFIQVSSDEVVEKNIAKPFWDLISSAEWVNVDLDMKEALDRRDSNDKDPAIFAAKALESAIKIVSDLKGWTRGKETGASSYIDNLISKANGSFLDAWEGEMLKDYFRKVRNNLGHGPGSEPMPALSIPQTDWAIETAMSWVRTLIRRM
ncbi:hypothetical protein GCM10007860_11190 [Chitiniphilus shinanonensis]|uniref:HEPN AbiJ-N-terminal domain-containing protein n=1 Tax=Chitiniphilus shinanonensis TaxID=553088 RepID=A0ABQ6BQQ8_9NEIS|nr:hypothetical protein [Chitiniphilus shinanonensis]GLS03973.1 hypothetical protein GCM10007860_11190 [Chitiniphilus shinanonensis]